ncbi:LysR family transcriptional regulator [Ruficoccus sp. ZRK36]|uniref:LysR family transcriptional regulator n=1 Tax=Ruficoccus sp. ZRK36 TaxID=2866311 RepID=UPI001C729D7B|nr:LysR family transcriptional regulator [Ruficoccus sp. ZRK36]QYY35799.1 LysR family transcriptional regulator [Ruficoccus sp. ZRK36]
MEMHQLRYFVELARQGNFSRAAAACYVSQPSLSQQIMKLEDELGQPLIHRTRKGALLTHFGEAMLPRARRILLEAECIRDEAQAQNDQTCGKINLGAIPTIAPFLLPSLMERCLEKYPQMQLSLVEDTTNDLVAALRNGRLDFALMSRPFPWEDELEAITLFEDELLVTVAKNSPLNKRRRIKLDDLAEHSMIVMKDMHCLGRQSISLCESSGLSPKVSIESSQLETVVSLVESGLGFSFIPKMAATQMEHRQVGFHSVSPKPVSRDIVLVWSGAGSLTRTQQAFRDEAAASRT